MFPRRLGEETEIIEEEDEERRGGGREKNLGCLARDR